MPVLCVTGKVWGLVFAVILFNCDPLYLQYSIPQNPFVIVIASTWIRWEGAWCPCLGRARAPLHVSTSSGIWKDLQSSVCLSGIYEYGPR